MNKKLIFAIVILLLVLVGWYFLSSSDEVYKDDYVPTKLPDSGNFDRPVDVADNEPLVIASVDGEMRVNDIRKRTDTVDMGADTYGFDGLNKSGTASFSIIFDESNDSFAVALSEEPIAASRLAAEAYLLGVLGITKEDMCKLNILVAVPVSINEFYSGTNLGVSYCPGSVALE